MQTKKPHVLSSSQEFAQYINSIEVDSASILVRIDVDHFFMSGSPDQLGLYAGKLFEDRTLRDLVTDVTVFLTFYQYVRSSVLPGRLWRTKRGSGMGLRCSGPICDAVFYTLVETWAVNPDVLSSHGIRSYKRFKDDIFLICQCTAGLRRWYAEFRRRAAAVFQTTVEQVSGGDRASVDMLQFTVTKNGNSLVVSLKAKQQEGPPLSSQSAHPPGVCMWPINFSKSLG